MNEKRFRVHQMTETFEATFFMSSFFFFQQIHRQYIFIITSQKKKKQISRTFEINQLELQLTGAHLESFQRGRSENRTPPHTMN